MNKVKIRKSGNANIVSLPKKLLKQLNIGVDSSLNISIQGGNLLLSPSYSLENILEDVTPEMLKDKETQEWLNMKPLGCEEI